MKQVTNPLIVRKTWMIIQRRRPIDAIIMKNIIIAQPQSHHISPSLVRALHYCTHAHIHCDNQLSSKLFLLISVRMLFFICRHKCKNFAAFPDQLECVADKIQSAQARLAIKCNCIDMRSNGELAQFTIPFGNACRCTNRVCRKFMRNAFSVYLWIWKLFLSAHQITESPRKENFVDTMSGVSCLVLWSQLIALSFRTHSLVRLHSRQKYKSCSFYYDCVNFMISIR